MDTNSPKNKKPIITRPLTETQQMESILNINDISDIVTPQSNQEEQRKIRKLEMDLQEAQKDVEVREKQIENLKKTQKHLESHQELQKKKIESLQKKIDALENETAKMRESQISEIVDTAPLEAKIKELEIECQKLKQENSRLKKDFDSKDVSVVEKSREVDKYKIKIEELNKKIEDSETKFSKKIKELQSKASVPQVKPKPEVVVDNRELEILKLANQKLTTQLAQAKSNAFSLKKQLEKHIAESEKAEKNTKSIENDLAEANKAKEFLKRKVRQLQETLKNKESSVSTDPDAQKSSKFNLEQELEDEDDEVSGCSPEDKEIKKILKSIFEAKNIWNRYPRTRVLNSIIVNAENLLEEDSDDDDY